MARWFLVTFIVACLLCVIQAFPQSADVPTTAAPTNKVGDALNDIVESLQKGLKEIIDDPNLHKLVEDGQRYLQDAASAIQSEAAKIVPKTD